MKTLDDFNLREKTVLIRVDLNSSIIQNKVQNSLRFKEHSKTLKELSEKKAKTVVLAHQGRKGKTDYLESLEQHSKILSKITKKNIIYINDLFGKKAIDSIKNLKKGDILLLKNTRSCNSETKNLSPKKHSQGKFVKTLKPYFDLFIQDALSICHRSHASAVGFPYVMPSCAGRVLQKELEGIEKIKNKTQKPFTLILGGKKIQEHLGIIKKYTKNNKADNILTTGILSLITYRLNNINLGLENQTINKQYKPLISKLKPYKNKLILPLDFAIDINGKRKEISMNDLPTNYKIPDIGTKTIKKYKKIINNSKTIFLKGSPGNYEKKGFEKATQILLKEIVKSKAFSLAAGGDTLTAIEKFKIKGFSHISLSGGALLDYLAEKKLPGLEVLKRKS